VGALIARGSLVSDELITALVGERLGRRDVASGFILDGYPRTGAQAEALDRILHGVPLIVGLIDVAAEEIVRRLGGRRVCESCQITQSVSDLDADPQSCPYCGGRLVRREDDEPETVRRRLATYAEQAEPLIAYYRERPGFFAVHGARRPDDVTAALFAEIDRRADRS
jgi:adenylate kinase